MSVVLYRIDERLIHGQVVVGWGPELEVERYVVVDDELAASEWEQDLYRLGLPEVATAEFLTVADARARLSELDVASPRTVVLTRTVTAMNGLAKVMVYVGVRSTSGAYITRPVAPSVFPMCTWVRRRRRVFRPLRTRVSRFLPGTFRGVARSP